jgi:soluble lytic murein transglycosylase
MKRRRKWLLPVMAALAVLAVAAALNAPKISGWALRQMYPCRFSETVGREAEEFGLPPELVYAVIKAESGFDPNARSRAGAMGLMQLTEETFLWMAEEHPPENGGLDRYDVDDNVHCGCALLRRLLDHYAAPEVALAAYNAGIGNVDRWLMEPEHSNDGRTLPGDGSLCEEGHKELAGLREALFRCVSRAYPKPSGSVNSATSSWRVCSGASSFIRRIRPMVRLAEPKVWSHGSDNSPA